MICNVVCVLCIASFFDYCVCVVVNVCLGELSRFVRCIGDIEVIMHEAGVGHQS